MTAAIEPVTPLDEEASSGGGLLARIEEAVRAAENELGELRARRQGLSLDAVTGDAEATEALASAEARIVELERLIDRAALAGAEADRREREAAEAAEAESRLAQEAEFAALDAKRLDLLAAVQRAAVRLGKTAAEFVKADDEASDLCTEQLDRRFSSLQSVAAELIYIRFADECPRLPQLERPRNFRANQLREQFPLVKDDKRCTACARDDRADIDAALEVGSVREVAERFGLTKSALPSTSSTPRRRRHGRRAPTCQAGTPWAMATRR